MAWLTHRRAVEATNTLRGRNVSHRAKLTNPASRKPHCRAFSRGIQNDSANQHDTGGYLRDRFRRAIRIRTPIPPPSRSTDEGSGVAITPANAGTAAAANVIPI